MSTVYIIAPQPDSFGIARNACPTCERKTFMVWWHTAWYGIDHVCLRCGEHWQDGQRCERPFARGWREQSKKAARSIYRRLRNTGRTKCEDFGSEWHCSDTTNEIIAAIRDAQKGTT